MDLSIISAKIVYWDEGTHLMVECELETSSAENITTTFRLCANSLAHFIEKKYNLWHSDCYARIDSASEIDLIEWINYELLYEIPETATPIDLFSGDFSKQDDRYVIILDEFLTLELDTFLMMHEEFEGLTWYHATDIRKGQAEEYQAIRIPDNDELIEFMRMRVSECELHVRSEDTTKYAAYILEAVGQGINVIVDDARPKVSEGIERLKTIKDNILREVA